MLVPLEHFPRQLDGVHHEAGADRARDALLKLLRQLIALFDEGPRHLDRQSQFLLVVGLSHESETVQLEVPHEIGVLNVTDKKGIQKNFTY